MSEKLQVGELLRYARPYNSIPARVDDLPNFFAKTNSPDQKMALLEAGINPIAAVISKPGKRRPAILTATSPHKTGSAETPWHDVYDIDRGHIRYYGDNKTPGKDPALAVGNKALLAAYLMHRSADRSQRLKAPPIIFFRRVSHDGRAKGQVKFQGFGMVEQAKLVTQFDRKHNRSFPNYAFDFLVFDLSKDHEEFDWQWISDRRNTKLSDEDSLRAAPASWNKWIVQGAKALPSCRRSVAKLLTESRHEQVPALNSNEERVLNQIYDFYAERKSRFEGLAAIIAARVIDPGGRRYQPGWITPPSSDGGADFIGRLDVGTGFSRAKLVVLGQAKCERPHSPTGGNHIARTVARLKRGWLGVYVTTSYFSEAVQREVIDDAYPILLINGARLAREVIEASYGEGFASVSQYLESVDSECDSMIASRTPEELLHDG